MTFQKNFFWLVLPVPILAQIWVSEAKMDIFGFFSSSVHPIFLIFCMKLDIKDCKKMAFSDFWGKFILGPNWGNWGIL